MTNATSYVVFAATSGIGSALARRLTASGATLTITGRSANRVTELARELGATPAVLDAADFDAVDRWTASASHRQSSPVISFGFFRKSALNAAVRPSKV